MAPEDLTVFNGELYFGVGVSGTKLFKVELDGSVVPVGNLPGSVPAGFTSFNGELYFSGNDGLTGTELWKVKADGSLVHASTVGNPAEFTPFNNELYFSVAKSRRDVKPTSSIR